MIDIKIGQLYSFHLDPNEPIKAFLGSPSRQALITLTDIVMEVTTIDGFVGMTPIKDREGLFVVGDEYIAKQSDVVYSGNYRLLWDPSMKAVSTEAEEYGVDCSKCGKYYPDTVKVSGFKCWACRNGF